MLKEMNKQFKVVWFFILILTLTIVSSCDTNLATDADSSTSNVEERSIEVEMGIPESVMKNLKSGGAKGLTLGLTVTAKAFDATTRALVATASLTTFTVTDGSTGKYSGTITIPPSQTGDIYLHVYAVYPAEHENAGQIAAQGTPSTAIAHNFTLKQSISSSTSYPIGSFGPGGGYIYGYNNYDADTAQTGSYSNGWRYLEAAPSDISESWSVYSLDTGYTTDASGNVYSGDTLIASIYDWYWGPNDASAGTNTPVSYGEPNTASLTTLDATSSSTPQIQKLIPRPFSASAIGRRKVSTTVSNLVKNGYDNWFTPSKDELETMYTNIKTSGNFANARYWTSSESTAVYETISSKNVLSGHYVDFSQSSLTSATTGRYFLYRVRPSRRF